MPFQLNIMLIYISFGIIMVSHLNTKSYSQSLTNGCYHLRDEMGFGRMINLKNAKFKETSGGCTHISYSKGKYRIVNDTLMVLFYKKKLTSSVILNSRLGQNDTLPLKYDSTTHSLIFNYWRVKNIQPYEFNRDFLATKLETKWRLLSDNRRRKKSVIRKEN